MKRRFRQSLIAVLAGNAIYFRVERFLPARAQHHLYQIARAWPWTSGFAWCVTDWCG